MAVVAFDTLKLAQRLQAAGMPQRQAQDVAAALAETITGDLVTREYLDLRLGEAETRLRGDIREAEARLRGEMREGDERLRGEIASLHSRLVWWIIGTAAGAVVTIIGAVAALLRLMHY
jgi:hypothetical protein